MSGFMVGEWSTSPLEGEGGPAGPHPHPHGPPCGFRRAEGNICWPLLGRAPQNWLVCAGGGARFLLSRRSPPLLKLSLPWPHYQRLLSSHSR